MALPYESVAGVVREILLSGLLSEDELFSEPGMRFVWGVYRLRLGLLRAGLRQLSEVVWRRELIQLLRELVEPGTLLNAVAEDVIGSFGKPLCEGPLALVMGAALGERICEIGSYYENSSEFVTRIVGLNYENRIEKIDMLHPGHPLTVLWDPVGTPDPNAVRVFSPTVGDLGFIRKTIASSLAKRIKRGEAFSAQVYALAPEENDPNERVYIKVIGQHKHTVLLFEKGNVFEPRGGSGRLS